jgi:hypothetical protein
MNVNNKAIYGLTGVVVFIISKLILGYIGIENMPVPIIISLLTVSYTMFLIGISNKKLIGKEKKYLIITAVFLAVSYISVTTIYITSNYFPELLREYKVLFLLLLIISIASFSGILITVTKMGKIRR